MLTALSNSPIVHVEPLDGTASVALMSDSRVVDVTVNGPTSLLIRAGESLMTTGGRIYIRTIAGRTWWLAKHRALVNMMGLATVMGAGAGYLRWLSTARIKPPWQRRC